MNRAYGVQVTVTPPGAREAQVAPVVVVARDDQDAAVVAAEAAEAAGAGAQAETLRELTAEEVAEHDLDLEAHGSVKSLALLKL